MAEIERSGNRVPSRARPRGPVFTGGAAGAGDLRRVGPIGPGRHARAFVLTAGPGHTCALLAAELAGGAPEQLGGSLEGEPQRRAAGREHHAWGTDLIGPRVVGEPQNEAHGRRCKA